MSFRSPFPDVEIPNLSVYDFLFGSIAESDLDKPALIDGTSGDVTTYKSLIGQVDAIAGALAARGLEVGDVVGLHSPNVPAFASVLHGILRAGGTATTINALYTAEDIAKQLTGSGAKFLFTVSPLYPQAKAAADKVGIDADHVIVLDGAEGHPSLRDLLTQGAPAPEVSFDPATHVAVLPYSSGTTGVPKGVILTHRNLVANVAQMEPRVGIDSNDAILAPVAVALAKHPMIDQYDLSSVHTIFSGAAPLDEELGKAVAKRLNTRVRQGYGMSELSPVSHAIPFDRDDMPLSSVGQPLANTENKLVDPGTLEEIELPTEGLSKPGELWVKGPNVMAGYLNNPSATAETLDSDGYLHTGDIAVADHEGVVYIVDRLKELIKYKGYQVPPAELEALLLTHEEIADAAVIGVLDDEGEEIPKAFVVRQQGATIDEEGIIAFVAERVSPHKKVRRVEFIDIVPKSAAGKILRKDLRAAEAGK